MKILITGGLGFLGKALASKLLENRKNKIFILDNFQYGKPCLNTKRFMIIKGDVRSKSDWRKLPRVDYVFHFAAPSSVILFNKDSYGCIQTTIQGMLNCIEWSMQNKVRKIIYPSSGSVYGNSQGLCSEDEKVIPLNIYGKTKLVCEQTAKLFENRIPLLGLRIFAGYGPQEDQKGGFASIITLFIRKMVRKKSPLIYGNGEQTRDFIYIDDIVKVLLRTFDNETTGLLNVGSGKKTSFNQVLNTINKVLRSNIHAKFITPPDDYLLSTQADTTKLKRFLPKTISLEDGVSLYLKSAGVML